MAYTKKNYKRKSYKKQICYKPQQSILGNVSRIGIKVLKSKLGLNTETKFVDTAQSGTCTSSLVGMNFPAVIAQGDTPITREGAGVRLVRWSANIIVSSDATATTSQLVRIVCFKQPKGLTGTQITPTNVMQTVSDIKSFFNMNTEGYNVFYDKTIVVDPISVGTSQKLVEIRYAPLQHELKWTNANTDGAVADVTAGFFMCAIMCQSGTTPPTFAVSHRVYFVDN